MALLPPPHHVPVSLASVYLLAASLREMTTRNDVASNDHLGGYATPQIIMPRRMVPAPSPLRLHDTQADHFPLMVVSVDLTIGVEGIRNPYLYEGVIVGFADAHGRRFSSPPEGLSMSTGALCQLRLHMKPPFTDCLAPKMVRASFDSGIARSFAPLPKGYEVKFPRLEHNTVTRYRQTLALGTLQAVLLQEDGRGVTIPRHFWRSEMAEGVFLQSRTITIEVDGRQVTGTPFVDIDVLRDGWQRAFGLSSARTRVTDVSYGPYINFMIEVAGRLGMVDGRGANGKRIPVDTVKQTINELWKERPRLTGHTDNKVDQMATLLRHPGDAAGGNVSWYDGDEDGDRPNVA